MDSNGCGEQRFVIHFHMFCLLLASAESCKSGPHNSLPFATFFEVLQEAQLH